MTHYYFAPMPDSYPGPGSMNHDRSLITSGRFTSRKAAEEHRERIERELNGGKLWSVEAIAAGEKLTYVAIMPFSQAREYVDFGRWPCVLAEEED